MRSERNELPGTPSNSLIRSVRSTLRIYMQCRPNRLDTKWLKTWNWAAEIADRSLLFQFGKSRRKRWPSATEIASQFILLSLVEMREFCALRLHRDAAKGFPEGAMALLPSMKALPAPVESAV